MKINNIRCQRAKNYDISLIQSVVNRKEINIEEIYYNGEIIYSEISEIGRDICVKAFDDLLVRNNWDNEVFRMQLNRDTTIAQISSILGFNQRAEYVPEHAMAHYNYQQRQQIQVAATIANVAVNSNLVPQLGQTSNQFYVGDHVVPIVTEEKVPPEERTIFLTFSKGYPIPMCEVVDFFNRMFGNFVESSHMQQVYGNDQPLYAMIVARNPSTMKAVVEKDGPGGKSKYNINGKHVWARKFVPRTSSN
ncbi:uncharacterized protein [Rutidosis leptorrhynchoides]|uniref:uncharacterized protein n=1 Tax=Rutidosis leptorrhynchoides TaxID=125765 RepID=UPI003A9987FA